MLWLCYYFFGSFWITNEYIFWYVLFVCVLYLFCCMILCCLPREWAICTTRNSVRIALSNTGINYIIRNHCNFSQPKVSEFGNFSYIWQMEGVAMAQWMVSNSLCRLDMVDISSSSIRRSTDFSNLNVSGVGAGTGVAQLVWYFSHRHVQCTAHSYFIGFIFLYIFYFRNLVFTKNGTKSEITDVRRRTGLSSSLFGNNFYFI